MHRVAAPDRADIGEDRVGRAVRVHEGEARNRQIRVGEERIGRGRGLGIGPAPVAFDEAGAVAMPLELREDRMHRASLRCSSG
jgi:hypothetical protein